MIFLALGLNLQGEFAVNSYYQMRNQNLLRQRYEESCGAASLANLINYLDFKNLSEKEVLEKMSNKTDMVSFLELQNTAKKLGYEAKGYQLSINTFEKLTMPVLVKVEDDPRFPHFVVAINHSGDFVSILDPSFGAYVSLKSEFYSLWDQFKSGGYALILMPKSSLKVKFKPNLQAPQSVFDILR